MLDNSFTAIEEMLLHIWFVPVLIPDSVLLVNVGCVKEWMLRLLLHAFFFSNKIVGRLYLGVLIVKPASLRLQYTLTALNSQELNSLCYLSHLPSSLCPLKRRPA